MDMALEKPRLQGRLFGKRVLIWLGVVGVILTTIAGLMFASITLLLKSEGWVAHSYQVLDALDLTESDFTIAQSAERGYVATCNTSMLSPFRRDLPQIFSKIATLRGLTADSPQQQERAVALGKTVSRELERASGIIGTATSGHQLQAEGMLADPRETANNRQIGKLIDDMQAAERSLLSARLHNVTLFAWTTLFSCVSGVLMIAGILIFVLRLIRRETARRERTEVSLQDSNEKLGVSLEELHHYNASAKAMAVLGELLQTCRSTLEAVSVAGRHMRGSYPEALASIALFNSNRDFLEVVNLGNGPMPFSSDFRPTACWGLRRGRTHLAGPSTFEPYCEHVERQSSYFICIPMLAQGETLGVLTAAMDHPMSEFDRQTMQTVSEQLALALANITLQETLRNQSLRDPLTGLFNRRFLDEAMHQEITRAARHKTPLSIAMIDIDHFKRFNDTYGHEGGDALLAAFGKLLVAHARKEDIVCRYGGEEFAIILPGAELDIATARLNEIRQAAKVMQVTSNGQSLGPVSMSAGLALYPNDGSTGTIVLAAADAALYEAKRSGRDRVASAHSKAADLKTA